MEMGLFEVAANAGVSMFLAAVVIYWYRSDTQRQLQDSREREERAARQFEQEREDKLLLLQVLGESNRVKAELSQALMELRRELSDGGHISLKERKP